MNDSKLGISFHLGTNLTYCISNCCFHCIITITLWRITNSLSLSSASNYLLLVCLLSLCHTVFYFPLLSSLGELQWYSNYNYSKLQEFTKLPTYFLFKTICTLSCRALIPVGSFNIYFLILIIYLFIIYQSIYLSIYLQPHANFPSLPPLLPVSPPIIPSLSHPLCLLYIQKRTGLPCISANHWISISLG